VVIGIDKGIRSKPYIVAAKKLNIPYKLITCTFNDAINQIRSVDALIWHWTHANYIEKRIAIDIIRSAELMGKKTYPNTNTCWTFDDKVSEKYLLESVNAPMIDTYIFFTKQEALKWISSQKLPIVYKLPQGAGSTNVRLIKNMEDAERVCNIHFSVFGRPDIGMKLYYTDKTKYIPELFNMKNKDIYRYGESNRGYIYFQKYLEGNEYDIRVTIIGERAVIFRRKTREGDFRASGSGMIDYNVSKEDLQAIPIAKCIAKKMKVQTMAFDFVYDKKDNTLKIIEISYGFVPEAVKASAGWYDDNMEFHIERTDVHEWVIESLIRELQQTK